MKSPLTISPLWIILAIVGLTAVVKAFVAAPEQRTYESDGWTTHSFPTDLSHPTESWAQGIAAEALPDRHLTPGAYFTEVPLDFIKDPGYVREVRKVTPALEKEVLERYGLKWEDRDQYVIDWLVPLCLGGSNDITNLWPMARAGEWSPGVKARAVHEALRQVRNKDRDLKVTQLNFSEDWIDEYKNLFPGEEPKAELTEEQ